ncbi:hypothetical protein ABMX48_36800 [Streptomyces cavourensis]
MRASVGIAQLALQPIEDDLTADDIDPPSSPRSCASSTRTSASPAAFTPYEL